MAHKSTWEIEKRATQSVKLQKSEKVCPAVPAATCSRDSILQPPPRAYKQHIHSRFRLLPRRRREAASVRRGALVHEDGVHRQQVCGGRSEEEASRCDPHGRLAPAGQG